jgi:hypothetical protein
MLKITSFLSLLAFLLFAGSGAYAHSETKKEAATASESSNKGDSKETKDKDGKSTQLIIQLDVFQAISLVNAQLRWKDFNSERSNQLRNAHGKKQRFDVQEIQNTASLTPVLPSPAIQSADHQEIFFSIWRIDPSISIDSFQPDLHELKRVVAFILNCGTYPHQQL